MEVERDIIMSGGGLCVWDELLGKRKIDTVEKGGRTKTMQKRLRKQPSRSANAQSFPGIQVPTSVGGHHGDGKQQPGDAIESSEQPKRLRETLTRRTPAPARAMGFFSRCVAAEGYGNCPVCGYR
jgi:hypothetical protein